MDISVFVFVTLLLIFIGVASGLMIYFARRNQAAKAFGPSELLSDPANIQGEIHWDPHKAPLTGLLGSSTRITYQLELVQRSHLLTGRIQARNTGMFNMYYEGEIYLAYQQGQVSGRFSIKGHRTTPLSSEVQMENICPVIGPLGQKEAFLSLGLPDTKQKNKLTLRTDGDQINWSCQRGALEKILLEPSGSLHCQGDEQKGQLNGQFTDRWEWGKISLECSYQDLSVPRTLLSAAVLLCSSAILEAEHGRQR